MMEQFHYTIPADQIEDAESDVTLVLPKFKKLPFGIMRKVRKTPEGEQIFEIFDQLVERGKITEEDSEILDMLDIEAIGALMEAWQKDAGVDIPES